MNSATQDVVEALVSEHRPMAARLARRYSHGAAVDPDLNQVADIGLFLAASRYEPKTGPFRPYAMVTIVGELKKHLRSHGWAVRVPRRLQESSIAVATASSDLEQQLKRSPTLSEVAETTGIPLEKVLQSLQARNARFGTKYPTTDPSTREHLDDLDLTIDVQQATKELPSQSQQLLDFRFNQELTQREIADRLNISQSQVHRRLTAVLAELREVLSEPRESEL